MRADASTTLQRIGSLPYKRELHFAKLIEDAQGNLWGLLNEIRENRWVACVYGDSVLVRVERLTKIEVPPSKGDTGMSGMNKTLALDTIDRLRKVIEGA